MIREEAEKYLRMLGQELQKQQVMGEILVADEVVMFLDIRKPIVPDIDAYLAGNAKTPKDISAYYEGYNTILLQTAACIAERESLPKMWLTSALVCNG